ncbi:Uncharacterised protein [Klebsiella pneumoniae]|uniref:Uncharacterized protein n=1 Tax=Klebsiella pneumoniae TaxID=573 RepID=A0A378FY19_KLEPN|nr:Uncharacterised protein [Klebsiella pneumoniae]
MKSLPLSAALTAAWAGFEDIRAEFGQLGKVFLARNINMPLFQ